MEICLQQCVLTGQSGTGRISSSLADRVNSVDDRPSLSRATCVRYIKTGTCGGGSPPTLTGAPPLPRLLPCPTPPVPRLLPGPTPPVPRLLPCPAPIVPRLLPSPGSSAAFMVRRSARVTNPAWRLELAAADRRAAAAVRTTYYNSPGFNFRAAPGPRGKCAASMSN